LTSRWLEDREPYVCLMGGRDPFEEADLVSGVVFCSSSRWTASEKRRQKAGSRTFAIVRGARVDRETFRMLDLTLPVSRMKHLCDLEVMSRKLSRIADAIRGSSSWIYMGDDEKTYWKGKTKRVAETGTGRSELYQCSNDFGSTNFEDAGSPGQIVRNER
jgi:hypothetical protein